MNKCLKNIEITGQDHQGRGTVKIEGKITFIENALPREICTIEITKERKKYQEAKAISWRKSFHEQLSCPYYEKCGGCNILHQKYEDQRSFKEQKVKELLWKFAHIDISLNPMIYDRQFAYRNKITLHKLGLYQKKTKRVVPIKECLLVDPRINSIIKQLQEYSRNSGDTLKEVMIRVSNQGQVLLDIQGEVQNRKLKKVFEDVDVLIVNQKKLTEKDYIIDMIYDTKFKISSASFYQVNRLITARLYDKVVEIYKEQAQKHVLDLYCGTGTIALLVAPFVQKVTGIEVIKEAIKNANDNKVINNIENAEFICGKVEDYIDKFKNIDSIIVDPPRAGLDSKTLSTILKIQPQLITYVSCDPVTLARDINLLKEKYNILEITPVDMFPNTYHVECVCVLNRR